MNIKEAAENAFKEINGGDDLKGTPEQYYTQGVLWYEKIAYNRAIDFIIKEMNITDEMEKLNVIARFTEAMSFEHHV